MENFQTTLEIQRQHSPPLPHIREVDQPSSGLMDVGFHLSAPILEDYLLPTQEEMS